MDHFARTCVGHVLLLVALAVPVFGAGCERQSDPPVTPRSDGARASPIGAAEAQGAGQDGVRHDDAAITARVKTALLADERVKGLRINVDTRDGKVTLRGDVETDQQVADAVEVTRSVEGVRDVVNRLSVKAEDKASRSNQG